MVDAWPPWLHILAATAWVGPQLMMFLVVMPSLRSMEDAAARYRFMQVLTPRFGWLGFGALALLVITGIENIRRYAPDDMFDLRYGYILTAKLATVAAMALITAVHSFYIGPAQMRLQAEALSRPDSPRQGELMSLRRRSMLLSSVTLLLSLGVLFGASLLRTAFAHHLV